MHKRKWVSERRFQPSFVSWRLQSNRDITDLIRTYWQLYCSSSYYSTGRPGAANMLMVSQLLTASNKRTFRKYLLYSNPILCCCSGMYAMCQFCLKNHPGNLGMLSEAWGPNVTGLRLRQGDLLYETLANDLQISPFKLWVKSNSKH